MMVPGTVSARVSQANGRIRELLVGERARSRLTRMCRRAGVISRGDRRDKVGKRSSRGVVLDHLFRCDQRMDILLVL